MAGGSPRRRRAPAPAAGTLTQTEALGTTLQQQQVTTIDTTGNAVQQTNGLGQTVWQVVLDAQDAVQQVVNALGGTTRYQRNADEAVTGITNAVGGISTLQLDALNRPTQVTDPNNNVSQALYNALDQVVVGWDGLGRATQSIYDLLGQLRFTISPGGGVLGQKYDPAGNESALTDPDGNTTTWKYNFRDQATEEQSPLGKTAYSYDLNGQLSKVVDRLGRSEEYTYQSNGWLTGITWKDAQGTVVDGLGYAYDADGQLTQASNRNDTYQWTYDALGRVSSQTDLDGITLNWLWPSGSVA